MALVCVKTLPILVLQSLCKIAFLQISASLCRTLASKPFEIQTWDWSRLKDFFENFSKCLFQKKFKLVFVRVLWIDNKVRLFFLSRVVIVVIKLIRRRSFAPTSTRKYCDSVYSYFHQPAWLKTNCHVSLLEKPSSSTVAQNPGRWWRPINNQSLMVG